MFNPYAVPPSIANERGIYGDGARLVRAGVLYRVIEFDGPFSGTFVYDGWWFRQKISVSGVTAWFRISWRTIFSEAEFTMPAALDADRAPVRVEIGFTRGLLIRRFRVWIDDALVYDEIN